MRAPPGMSAGRKITPFYVGDVDRYKILAVPRQLSCTLEAGSLLPEEASFQGVRRDFALPQLPISGD